MKFLTVLILIFLYRNWVGDHPIQSRVPFAGWRRWFFGSNLPTNLRYLLCVGLPVLVVAVLAANLAYGLTALLWLLLSLLVILYAVDIYDADAVFEDHRAWLSSLEGGKSIDSLEQRHEDFMMLTAYEYFQSLFPPLFWFLILGPAGPLAYILSRHYLDALDEDDPEIELVDQIVYWMEWAPVRVTGFIAALLGHFSDCFDRWLTSLSEFNGSNTVALTSMLTIAIDAADYDGEETQEEFVTSAAIDTDNLQNLLNRSVFGWLGVAAIITIIGW